jgi:hypothetical protein
LFTALMTVIVCAGPPVSVPYITPVTVGVLAERSMETPTTRYGFFDEPTVWFQLMLMVPAVDAVAGVAFEAASKVTCAAAGSDASRRRTKARLSRSTPAIVLIAAAAC